MSSDRGNVFDIVELLYIQAESYQKCVFREFRRVILIYPRRSNVSNVTQQILQPQILKPSLPKNPATHLQIDRNKSPKTISLLKPRLSYHKLTT
ncbi:hypothetical protein CDAR_547241 [Caerostris darwini]|uniref:Uncharacterized protein n=1 Tax=Caerostris darwini TaxID=1538125 RepID=A0AAV4WX06_9ARAC|nr:hypothetical protein CDAR_547241 [Caerostris darwini]